MQQDDTRHSRQPDPGNGPTLPAYSQALHSRHRAAGYWPDDHLITVLRHTAARDPHRMALCEADTEISYGELVSLVDGAVQRLRKSGIGAGNVMAVQLPNSAHLVVAILAIWTVGGVYHPLNPAYRLHDVSGVIERSKPRGFLFAEGGEGRALVEAATQAAGQEVTAIGIDLEGPVSAWAGVATDPLAPVRLSADAPLLLGATSGSTGVPKLYLHTQASQHGEARVLNDALELGPDDVFLAIAPLTHRGAFLFGLVTAIAAGAGLVVLRRYDPDAVLATIRRHRVTSFMSIPTQVVDLLARAESDPAAGASLRVIMISGSAVHSELVDALARLWPDCLPITGYGTSETGYSFFTRPGDSTARLRTCGRLMPGMEVRIDRPDGSAESEPGEILLRGAFAFPGYLDPAETERAFCDGWFRTGDLGRMDSDGYLTITGRLKNTIVRAGLNIQAEEVEALLAGIPGVIRSAVVPVPDPRLGETALAYLETSTGVSISLADIQRHLNSLGVAKFKWPEAVQVIPALPLNPVGKIDRIALARMAVDRTAPKGTQS